MRKLIARWIERKIVEDTRRKIGREAKKINGRILDLGCGEKGSFNYGNLEVIGADKSKEKLKQLKIRKKVVADAEKRLPFKNKEFDAVIFSGVIQYLKNYEKSIREINRILKSNGKLILATVNRESLFRKLGVIKKEPKKEAGEHRIFSKREIKDLLERYGFQIKKVKGADFITMPKDLSSNLLFVALKAKKSSEET